MLEEQLVSISVGQRFYSPLVVWGRNSRTFPSATYLIPNKLAIIRVVVQSIASNNASDADKRGNHKTMASVVPVQVGPIFLIEVSIVVLSELRSCLIADTMHYRPLGTSSVICAQTVSLLQSD